MLSIDHGARGSAGEDDLAFTARLAAELSLPFRALRADPRAVWKHGVASEARLRRERLRLLGEGAADFGAGAIYLAHHRDDQVETIVLAALRRAGLRGLSGMRRRRRLVAGDPASPWLVRPLLDVEKSALQDALAAGGFPYRVDETNADPRYLRNRIRQRTLPALRERLGSGLDDALLRLGRVCRVLERAARARGRSGSLDRDAIHARAAELLSVPLGRDAGAALLSLRDAPSPRVLEIAPGRRLLVGTGRIEKVPAPAPPEPTRERRREYRGASRVARILRAFSALGRERLREHLRRTNALYLDPDRVAGPLETRAWRPGDRIVPFGASRPVKLKDMFPARGVTRAARAVARVYTDAAGIVAVEGLDVAARVALTAASVRVLRIRGASRCRMAESGTVP